MFSEFQFGVAALRDLNTIGQRIWQIGKQFLHLRLGFEILFLRKLAFAARIAERIALGYAYARFVRAKAVFVDKLNRVSGDDGRMMSRSQ